MRAPFRSCHLFAGLGGDALGFRRAGFEIVGAFDADRLACQAFEYLTGVAATCADLATMQPDELRAACTARPDVVVTSPPCKGSSGCLPQAMAETPKYQAMNSLSLRGIWLALEAWSPPPALIVLENVPRITTRGRAWLDQVVGLLHAYGYAVAETIHDAGELGGLAQRRRRFLLVARHMHQVPSFLRLPPLRPLRGVGEVLGTLPVPLPGSTDGGPMHRLPRMSALNWVRLSLIPAGGDWRDLPPAVAIAAGPHRHRGGFGVGEWDEPAKTVVGAADPRHKPVSVADPRLGARAMRQNGGFGVEDWSEPAHAVIAEGSVRNTRVSVADPRIAGSQHRHNGKYGVEEWGAPAHTVIGEARTGKGWAGVADPRIGSEQRADSYGVNGWQDPSHAVLANGRHDNSRASVADPRVTCERREGSMGVTGWDKPSTSVIANGRVHNGPWQVADPRLDHGPRRGTYGVVGWAEPSHCIRAHQDVRQSPGAVADPRVPELVGPPLDLEDRRPCYVVIVAADGTWHRPMTTLELAVLQSLPAQHRGDWLRLPGNDAQIRALVGNAIPPLAAEAIARACAEALTAAGRFTLSNEDIWVAPTALSAHAG